MRVLGIDPGSRVTGYGLIEVGQRRHTYLDSGCIRVTGDTLGERLGMIFRAVDALIETYTPTIMAVETVFMSRNASSALKLGQARGAAVCAGAARALAVAEYAPRSIKQAIVGRGGADKVQIQHMIGALLALDTPPPTDAADALAVAICHAHHAATPWAQQAALAPAAGRGRRRR